MAEATRATAPTPGQALHEALCESAVAEFGMPVESFDSWNRMRESQRKRIEAAARAVIGWQRAADRREGLHLRDDLRADLAGLLGELETTIEATSPRRRRPVDGKLVVALRKLLDPSGKLLAPPP